MRFLYTKIPKTSRFVRGLCKNIEKMVLLCYYVKKNQIHVIWQKRSLAKKQRWG